VLKIVAKPEIKKHFDNEGEAPRPMSPAELTAFVQGEVARWSPVVRAMVKK
jgi:tripartite-type tricarboxylate transporter receptor subunit TctC